MEKASPVRTVAEYDLRQVCMPDFVSFQVPGSLRILSVYVADDKPMASIEVTEAEEDEAWTLRLTRNDKRLPEPFVSLGLCTNLQGQPIFTLWGHRFA